MISFGLELEGIYNKETTDLPERHNYHHGNFLEGTVWKAESDGSLNMEEADYRAFGRTNAEPVELISKRLVGRDALMNALNVVKETFCGNKPLKDCIRFNKSCGTHIHFSIRGRTKARTHIKLLYGMRQEFFDKINSSTVIKKTTKAKILKHYNRSYSELMTKEDYLNKQKRGEFNFMSEDSGKGLEWRSINLFGVNKWVELYEVMDIVYNIVKKFDRKVRKYNVVERVRLNQATQDRLALLLDIKPVKRIKVKI